tara:strand:+ start:833 stop:1573 length:741 start_codon:yes stop_codon:yes gene_type:complete
MKNKHFFALFLISLIPLTSFSITANAQEYLGDLTPPAEERKNETIKPIPKFFSAHLRSVNQAEKLDTLYYNLYVIIWNSAKINYNHQGKLMMHLQKQKFQYTRYMDEFKGDMQSAMKTLNKQHKDVQTALDKANLEFRIIREGIATDEHEKLDTLWNEKIKEFKGHSDTYFKSQHKYLVTYKNLIEFIIKQGGSYYYDSAARAVKFYDLTGYTYFAKSIDELTKISFNQKKYLRKIAPFLSAIIAP